MLADRSPARAPFPCRFATLLLAAFCLAALPTADLHADAQDPVLEGVLEMLKAEMSEPIIRQWLSTQRAPSAAPSATAMVELRKAGASDELLSHLLELSQKKRVGRHSADGHPLARRRSAKHPPVDGRAVVSPAPKTSIQSVIRRDATTDDVAFQARPKADARPVDDGKPVSVVFSLSYSPYVVEDEEEWQLYLYLDGKPLTYVPSSGLVGKPLRFSRAIEPGDHQLRITRERHQERRRQPTEHEAVVAAVLIPLSLEAGVPADVEVQFKQSIMRSKNPLTYRIQQGQRVVLQEDIGGDPDRWQEICEDIELSRSSDKEPSRSERKRLGKCVRWTSLWSEEHRTARDKVIEAMSRFDFRPIPREQSLH